MKYLRNLAFCMFFLGLSTCVDPYRFGFEENVDQDYVIEGYLTNIPGVHQIRVSRTTFIGEFNGVVADFIPNADVSIVDDQGEAIPLTYDRNGIYLTGPNAVAMPGRSYKVRAEMATGEIFESSFETLTEELGIDNDIEYSIATRESLNDNNFIVEESGVKVVANIEKTAVDKYYRWEVDHYFLIESDLAPSFRSPQEQEGLTGTELRFCFIKDYPFQDLHLLRDVADGQALGSSYQFDLEFIPIDKRFEYEFVVESKMLAIPEKDFTFWSNIQELAEGNGGLFDAAPFAVVGNIREVSDNLEEERVGLGFFGVYNASIDREFINPDDIGISGVFNDCSVPAAPGPPRPHPCKDCRLYEYQINYENNPPAWWNY